MTGLSTSGAVEVQCDSGCSSQRLGLWIGAARAAEVLRAQKTVEFAVPGSISATKRRTEMARPWYVINPDSNRIFHVWQMITNIALAFIALVTPLQVGLLEIQWDALFVTWS